MSIQSIHTKLNLLKVVICMSGNELSNSLVPLSGQKSVLEMRCLNEKIGRPVDASLFHREILDKYKEENPPECPGASLVFEEAMSNKSFPLLLRLGAAWTTNKYVKVNFVFWAPTSVHIYSYPLHQIKCSATARPVVPTAGVI